MATDGAHGGEFVPAGPTHNYEYEPDQFAVKTILAVPVVVLVTGVIAFTVTWLLFSNIFDPAFREPADIPSAGQRNDASLNERFERMSSTDPNAEVQQPRLEGLQKTQVYHRDGDPKNNDPKNLVTSQMSVTQPTADGNSPRYHAEDLRPDRVGVLSTGKTDPKTGITRVPVDEAIRLLVDGKLLPAREGAPKLDIHGEWDRPKESNGGNSRWPAAAKPTAAKKADDKKEPNGKDNKKGGDDKKGGDEKKGDAPAKK